MQEWESNVVKNPLLFQEQLEIYIFIPIKNNAICLFKKEGKKCWSNASKYLKHIQFSPSIKYKCTFTWKSFFFVFNIIVIVQYFEPYNFVFVRYLAQAKLALLAPLHCVWLISVLT